MANGNQKSGEVSFHPDDFQPVATGAVSTGEVSFAPSAFQAVDTRAEVPIDATAFKPAPDTTATAAPPQPSVWDRITRVITESPLAHSLGDFFDPNRMKGEWEAAGPELRKRPEFALRHAPATSPEAWKAILSWGGVKQFPSVANEAVNRAFGVVTDSPISPSAAMTPAEQQRHPIATATGDVLGGMASGGNIATIAATGGFGELGAAGKTLSRLVSAGFSISQLWDAAKTSPEVLKAIRDGDAPRAQYLLARMGITTGLAYLGAKHAATGKGAVTGRTGETVPATVPVEEHAAAADSPLAQLTGGQRVPEARVVESHAQRTELEQREQTSPIAEPERVFHGTTSNVTDVSELDPAKSRDGAAGRGIYLSENPAQASAYAGPAEPGTGGRVLGGLLTGNAKLLNGNAPLPAELRTALKNEFPDLDTSASYIEMLDGARKGKYGIEVTPDQVQSAVENLSDYDGVKYEHQYPEGPRRALMLFRNSVDLLKPTVPTMARVVPENHVPVVTHNEILTERIQRMVDNSGELQKLGLDPTKIQNVDDVQRQLETAATQLKQNLDPRVTDTLTFDMQRKLASELGMTVEDLLSRKSGAPFNAEEVTAARSLMKASQARVLDIAKKAVSGEIEPKAMTDALAQHREILDVVRGQVAKEAGRALGAFRIDAESLPSAKIADLLSKLSPEEQMRAAELIAKTDTSNPAALNRLVSELTPSSTWDKLFEAWQNSLLSSPKTGIIKASSDTTMLFLNSLSKFTAGALAKDRSPLEGWAFAKGAANALARAGRVLLGGSEEGGPGFEDSHNRIGAIKGTLGQVVRVPMTVIGRISDAAHVLNYSAELESLAYRKALGEGLTGQALEARQAYLVENPTTEMRRTAYVEAKRQTFQAELGKSGKATQKFIRTIPGLRYLAPFFKTPANIVKQAAEYSPYGAVKGALRGDVDLASRGIVGSAIASAIVYHALQGDVTGGGPIDFRKRETLQATGWQPYSIKIGGRYFSYNRLEPLGMIFGLTADLIHAIHTGEDPENVGVKSRAEHIQSIIARNIEHLPFVNGLANALEAFQPGNVNRTGRLIRNQASEVVPAIVAQTAQAIDPTVRKPGSVGEAIEAKLPGLTGNVPPVTDVSGQPVRRPASAVGGMNPFPATTAKNDAAVSEMARLGVTLENPPAKVTQPKAGLGLKRGEKAPSTATTPEEARALQSQDAALLTAFLREVVSDDGWSTIPDEQKRDIVKRARTQIAATRWERLFRLRVANAQARVQQPAPAGSPSGMAASR